MNYTVVLHFKSNDYNAIDIRADAPVSLAEGTELVFSEYALSINYYTYNHASDSSNYLNPATSSWVVTGNAEFYMFYDNIEDGTWHNAYNDTVTAPYQNYTTDNSGGLFPVDLAPVGTGSYVDITFTTVEYDGGYSIDVFKKNRYGRYQYNPYMLDSYRSGLSWWVCHNTDTIVNGAPSSSNNNIVYEYIYEEGKVPDQVVLDANTTYHLFVRTSVTGTPVHINSYLWFKIPSPDVSYRLRDTVTVNNEVLFESYSAPYYYKNIYVYTYTPKWAGRLYVTSTSSETTHPFRAYICEGSQSIDPSTGIPATYLATSDRSEGTLNPPQSVQTDVVANTTYYVYVICNEYTIYGNTTIINRDIQVRFASSETSSIWYVRVSKDGTVGTSNIRAVWFTPTNGVARQTGNSSTYKGVVALEAQCLDGYEFLGWYNNSQASTEGSNKLLSTSLTYLTNNVSGTVYACYQTANPFAWSYPVSAEAQFILMANDWNELRYRYLAKQNKYYYDDSILWDFIYLNATSRNTYITKIVSGETTYDKWEVVNSDNTVMANDYNKMAEEAGISNRVSSGQVVTAALINALTQNL